MNLKLNDGGREAAGFKGKTGDCVCRAIAIATGKPYQEIYERLAAGNKSQRITCHRNRAAGKKTAAQGIYVRRKWFKDYMKELGFEWVACMGIGSGCKVHLREGELPSIGRLVVSVSKHLTCVIDGELNDTYDCRRGGNRCVYGYWILKA